jgi:hypothetical protein
VRSNLGQVEEPVDLAQQMIVSTTGAPIKRSFSTQSTLTGRLETT